MNTRHLLLCLLVACGSPPLTGPQPLGASSRAFVGATELELRYRYEPTLGKELKLYIDLIAKKGDTGTLEVSIDAGDFAVVAGKTEWRGAVSPARTETLELTLRAAADAPELAIVTRHVERDIELASDRFRFVVTEDQGVRECQPELEGCK